MDFETLAREWIKAHAPQLCFEDGSIGSEDLESFVSLLRSVAAQARREGIEEGRGMVLDAPERWELGAANKLGFVAGVEAAAKAAEEHLDHIDCGRQPQAHMEPPYICNVAQAIRALATKDKEPASAPTAQSPWSGGHE